MKTIIKLFLLVATVALIASTHAQSRSGNYRIEGSSLVSTSTAIAFETTNGVNGHGGSIDVAGQIIAGDWLYVLSGYSMFGQLPGNVLLAYKIRK